MFIKNYILITAALAVTSCAPVYADLSERQAAVATQAESTTTQQTIPTMQGHKVVDALELEVQKMKPKKAIKKKRTFMQSIARIGKRFLKAGLFLLCGTAILCAGALIIGMPLTGLDIFGMYLICQILGTAPLLWWTAQATEPKYIVGRLVCTISYIAITAIMFNNFMGLVLVRALVH